MFRIALVWNRGTMSRAYHGTQASCNRWYRRGIHKVGAGHSGAFAPNLATSLRRGASRIGPMRQPFETSMNRLAEVAEYGVIPGRSCRRQSGLKFNPRVCRRSRGCPIRIKWIHFPGQTRRVYDGRFVTMAGLQDCRAVTKLTCTAALVSPKFAQKMTWRTIDFRRRARADSLDGG